MTKITYKNFKLQLIITSLKFGLQSWVKNENVGNFPLNKFEQKYSFISPTEDELRRHKERGLYGPINRPLDRKGLSGHASKFLKVLFCGKRTLNRFSKSSISILEK